MATKRQNERLLRVAKALREHPAPKRFKMSCYINGDDYDRADGLMKEEWCGTPACALGTFASRPDLQRLLKIETYPRGMRDSTIHEWRPYTVPQMVLREDGRAAYFDSVTIKEYFGLDTVEALNLFGAQGCGEAKTPIAAAKFIEAFVANRS